MDIYVLNNKNEMLDIVDTYKSAIWDLSYNDVGNFELYVACTSAAAEIFKAGNRLVRDVDISADGSMHHVMIIKKIETTTDDDDGDNLIITGQDLKSILDQRIVWNQTMLSGSVDKCIAKLMNENVIAPENSNRMIDNFKLVGTGSFKYVITNQQFTGDSLLDSINSILVSCAIGYDIYIAANGMYIMYLYKGVDRSASQEIYPQVIFSSKNENIIDDTYTIDYSEYKNVALVAGEGEGKARRTMTVGKARGLDRYEVYVDAKDISSNDDNIADAEYNNMLTESGKDYLAERSYTEKYEGTLETKGIYIYGEDYNLGDIVTVINKYGITASPRITSVIESVSDEGVSIVPTLSTWIGD